MRVIIAGSRSIDNYELVKAIIERAPFKITEIVSGTAIGVDRHGERFAEEYNLPVKKFPASWSKYGRRAGYLRNVDMADYADALIAVWDGESKGTRHMINIMDVKRKPVFLQDLSKF